MYSRKVTWSLRRDGDSRKTLADQFWRRWMREYVPSLTERKKWQHSLRNLQENDVVLIVHPETPRGKWPLGRVTKVFRGSDDVIRSALVKTQNGEYHRPEVKLCLLETDGNDEMDAASKIVCRAGDVPDLMFNV